MNKQENDLSVLVQQAADNLSVLRNEKLNLEQSLARVDELIIVWTRLHRDAKEATRGAKGAGITVAEAAARLESSPFEAVKLQPSTLSA